MNRIIKTAILTTACCCLTTTAIYAQSIMGQCAIKSALTTEACAGKTIKVLKHNAAHYLQKSAGLVGALNPNAYNKVLSRELPVGEPFANVKVEDLPKTLQVTPDKIKNQIEKYKTEQARQQQAVLSARILVSRESLLKGYTLPENYLEGYFMRRIFPYQAKPSYTPSKRSDEVLFRGMFLTPEELAKIIREGFSPSTARWNSGTDGRPAVSLSSSEREAQDYIFQSGYKKNAIGVVFEVRRRPSMTLGTDELLNSTKTIYYSYEDIPAGEIVGVNVWGEYGLEKISDVFSKALTGEIRPHTNWTGQFDQVLR